MTAATEVLVIDDSATIRKLVELSMRGSSLRPHFAETGLAGVEQARALHPAVILLDCVLPDISGVEVCRRLAADPGTRTIPVLLVTARAVSARDEFREFQSVVDFVPKPFTGPDLLARIGRATGVIAATPRLGRDVQERVARILYARLKDGFALIPSLMSRLGGSPPAPFFAKQLLTPEVMAALLQELMELSGELQEPPPRHSASSEEAPLTMPPSAVLTRVAGFSDKVRQARLSSIGRRMLTVIDGRQTLAEIGHRIGIEVGAVCAVAQELITSGLLQDCTSAAHAQRPRPVVILEPDVQGFQRPLASMLETRPLVAVNQLDEVLAAAHRMQPCLVVLNATREKGVGDTARRMRSDAALADVALVAVLDPGDRGRANDLYAAGFDAVLNKPVFFGDLERFIALGTAR